MHCRQDAGETCKLKCQVMHNTHVPTPLLHGYVMGAIERNETHMLEGIVLGKPSMCK